VGERFDEEALTPEPDAAGPVAVVQHHGGAQRRQVLDRAEADLVLRLPVLEGLAIDRVLLRHVGRAAETQHQRADAS